MDSLLHSSHKIMLERATANNNDQDLHQIPDTAPPAYTEPCGDNMTEYEDYEHDSEDPAPITLSLNADTQVHGAGNMIATPPLADATRLSTLLLTAVQSLNAAETDATDFTSRTPVLHVNLTINCGITVHGDRNVIGYRTQGVLPTASKRKAVDEDNEDATEAKRARTE